MHVYISVHERLHVLQMKLNDMYVSLSTLA